MQKNTEEVTKACMRFWYSMGGRNIFMHGWKGWKNPCGKIDRGHHRHIRMDRIWFYDLFWYWDIQTDNAEGKVER